MRANLPNRQAGGAEGARVPSGRRGMGSDHVASSSSWVLPATPEQCPGRTMTLKRKSLATFTTLEGKRGTRKMRWGEPVRTGGHTGQSHLMVDEPQRPWRVLVAEDQSRLRDIAVDALARTGMVVRKTSRPDYLLAAVRRFKPDVIVLDDRFSRARVAFSSLVPTLKERFPGVRVIVTSDADRPARDYSADPVNWGAWDVVSKRGMLTLKGQEDLIKSVQSAVEA